MKKLMMLLTVAAMGFCANAAQVYWSVQVDYRHEAYDGSKIWAFLTGVNGCTDYSLIEASLANGTFDASLATFSGIVNRGHWDTDSEIEFSGEVPLQSLIVVFNTNDKTQYATTLANDTQMYGPEEPYYEDQNWWDGTNIDWKTYGGGDIPEPTSGLLLLIGAAGLALRRKRI